MATYSEPTITPFNPFQNNLLPDNLARFTRIPPLFPPLPLTPNNPTPLEEFTLFPTLPFELRLQIIRHALPLQQSRIVLARPYAVSSQTRLHTPGNLTHTKSEYLFASPSLPPVALWVNREWRLEALRFYRLCFGFGDAGGLVGGMMYFNSNSNGNSNESGVREEIEVGREVEGRQDNDERVKASGNGDDILYFEFTGQPFYSNLGYFAATIPGEGCSRMDISLVTRIALSHRMVIGRPNSLNKLVRRLHVFPNLEEVIVAIERGASLNVNLASEGVGRERVVGREARLVPLGGEEGWDEETKDLVREIDEGRELWGDLGWRLLHGLPVERVPRLVVMNVVDLEEREGTSILRDEDVVDGEIEGEVVLVKGKKDVVSLLGKMWRRLQIGGKKSG